MELVPPPLCSKGRGWLGAHKTGLTDQSLVLSPETLEHH